MMKVKDYQRYLAPRARDANKGDFGHLLIVGGDVGLTGAPRIAAMAAARVGAGLITVATRDEHDEFMGVTYPEIMTLGIISAADLNEKVKHASVIVLGPGLGKSSWSEAKYDTILESDKPMLLDADALNLLAENPQKRDHWVLTPHPGEASRLLAMSVEDIQKDRQAAAMALQKKYGGVVVLKGAHTLVVAEDASVKECPAGNPGMASGGMGDLLSGVIGALMAQGLPLPIAAECGVCLHAQAGDLAALQDGERGMLATDLLMHLRHLVNLRK